MTYLCHRQYAFELREVRNGTLTKFVITETVGLRFDPELTIGLFMGGGLHGQTKVNSFDLGLGPRIL